MADRQPSLADMCVVVLAEVSAMDSGMAKDDQLRYQVDVYKRQGLTDSDLLALGITHGCK